MFRMNKICQKLHLNFSEVQAIVFENWYFSFTFLQFSAFFNLLYWLFRGMKKGYKIHLVNGSKGFIVTVLYFDHKLAKLMS